MRDERDDSIGTTKLLLQLGGPFDSYIQMFVREYLITKACKLGLQQASQLFVQRHVTLGQDDNALGSWIYWGCAGAGGRCHNCCCILKSKVMSMHMARLFPSRLSFGLLK